jgi:hypothetical protein
LSREQGLLELEGLGMTNTLPEEVEHYCRELGLTMEDWRRYIGRPLPLSVKLYFARNLALQKLKSFWSSKK